MNAPLHHRLDDGADAALADALFDKALAGERYIAAGKVPANAVATYRREVTLLRTAAARLAARPAVTLPATIVDHAEDSYHAFLEKKIPVSEQDGFEIEPHEVNPALAPFTRLIVQWALRGGRRGLFLNFGLHKTVTQIDMARLALKYRKGPALIVLPLGVRHEFFDDAARFFTGEFAVKLNFINRADQLDPDAINLTNYEPVRDGKLDPKVFGFVSLDEAAVLRGYGTKTFQTFLPLFAGVPLRFVATATPSPNRTKELIHYAGYLGIMDTGQALTRFFQRNSSKAGDLQLYPHKESEFWTWVHSWALFLQSPADLGFDDTGYVLPPITVNWIEVPSDHAKAGAERDGQVRLFTNAAAGLASAAREKRDSISARVDVLKGLLSERKSTVLLEAPGEREGALLGELLSQQTQDRPGEEEGVHGGVPEDVSTSGTHTGREGGAQSETARTVRDGSCASGEDQSAIESERVTRAAREKAESSQGVRPYSGAIRSDAGAAGRLCDLRVDQAGEAEKEPASGSRSSDGQGARDTLRQLQHGTGPLQEPPGTADQGSGIPQWVVWCDLNDEQRAAERAIEDLNLTASSIDGSMSDDEREYLIRSWKGWRTNVFLSKPLMFGAGTNLQQCNHAIFLGVGYKFHDFIQACHRIRRYGQTRDCRIDIIHTEAERGVVAVLKEKAIEHDRLMARMAEIIRRYGLNHAPAIEALKRSIGVTRVEVAGRNFTVANNDCVAEARRTKTESVGLIVTSVPFSNHYEYTAQYEDFGHTDDNAHFWAQMDFLTPELFRILQPGRLACIHVKDRVLFGAVTGAGVPTISPFHAEAIFHFRKHGFDYMGMITIVTDVVRENNATYRLGWSENAKDSTKMGVGSPEYVILMRKPQSDRARGYADTPVTKLKKEFDPDVGEVVETWFMPPPEGGDDVEYVRREGAWRNANGYSLARWQLDAHAFWRSAGNLLLKPREFAAALKQLGVDQITAIFQKFSLAEVYDHEYVVHLGEELGDRLPKTFMALQPASAHPAVWTDVNRMRTLNSNQAARRAQLHICPLQFDIVDRLVTRYSNEGDLVYDPFCGLGTVPLRAMMQGRRGQGSELDPVSFADSVHYLQGFEAGQELPTLFDVLDRSEVAA